MGGWNSGSRPRSHIPTTDTAFRISIFEMREAQPLVELAAALRDGSHEDKSEEFADVLAWLTTIANVAEVDLSEAIHKKYGSGCPGCGQFVCTCPDAGKP